MTCEARPGVSIGFCFRGCDSDELRRIQVLGEAASCVNPTRITHSLLLEEAVFFRRLPSAGNFPTIHSAFTPLSGRSARARASGGPSRVATSSINYIVIDAMLHASFYILTVTSCASKDVDTRDTALDA